MRFEWAGRRLSADLSRPVSIAIPLEFDGPQAACFDAPPASARPLYEGLRCRCDVLTLAPHCNGTHTECVGHLTDDRVAVCERVPGGLVLALLMTIAPVPAEGCGEDSDPAPQPGDRLVTAAALASAFARFEAAQPRALVLRTADPASGPLRSYRGGAPAAYLSRQAAAWLVARGVQHLVLDLPSADRADDGGRLTAHRAFFGLPAGSRRSTDAARPQASITELAWIDGAIADGWYLLDLQMPAFLSDAAPSRPLLYAVGFE